MLSKFEINHVFSMLMLFISYNIACDFNKLIEFINVHKSTHEMLGLEARARYSGSSFNSSPSPGLDPSLRATVRFVKYD